MRNFTRDPKAGVRHKGTFKGLQEKIDYLKELGINQIKLMPIYEYEEALKSKEEYRGTPNSSMLQEKETAAVKKAETRKNRWGYAGAAYYAPKASYAATDNSQRDFEYPHLLGKGIPYRWFLFCGPQ